MEWNRLRKDKNIPEHFTKSITEQMNKVIPTLVFSHSKYQIHYKVALLKERGTFTLANSHSTPIWDILYLIIPARANWPAQQAQIHSLYHPSNCSCAPLIKTHYTAALISLKLVLTLVSLQEQPPFLITSWNTACYNPHADAIPPCNFHPQWYTTTRIILWQLGNVVLDTPFYWRDKASF